MLFGDIPLRFSRWTFVFEQKEADDIALYHSLNIDVIFLEKKFKQIINLLKLGTTLNFLIQKHHTDDKKDVHKIINALFKNGLIVECGADDFGVLREKRNQFVRPVGLETLYLMLTDQCNLRCSYCFINNNMPLDYVCRNMKWDVAKKAIDVYFASLAKNPIVFDKSVKTIFFYGGEPLLNFSMIKKCTEYINSVYKNEIKKMGNKFRLSLITNGTLIDSNIAKFLAEHKNISVGISLDGNKKTNDQKRKYQDGSGSFDNIARGIDFLKRAGCKNISLSCTVDNHNIDELSTLLDLNDKYGFIAVNMNIVLDTKKEIVSDKYMKKVSKKLLDYFVFARNRGFYEDRIMRKLKAFISNKIHAFDCQATGNQIVCSPDGQIGLCHEGVGAKNFFFSSVDDSLNFHNHSMVKEWNERSPLNMPQCFSCSALGLCGGGCAYGAWLRSGSIWSVDNRFCTHSLETLEWLIWDLYKQILKSSP